MTAPVRFLMDGELIEISQIDPTRTVLQYLREDLQRTGSKEGCGEGDCGACMVVVASLNEHQNGLEYKAINSCIQFVATLDGKELITVESLRKPGAELHPVQQAMVDCHGSQCGFCTPGFVMTLFALYRSQATADRREINDALSGNLCRCTGYRPIVDAAVQMYTPDAAADESDGRFIAPFASAGDKLREDEQAVVDTLKKLQRNETTGIGQQDRHIFSPVSTDEFAALYIEHTDATLLAGGTDVGLWVTKQFRDMAKLIYIGGVKELQAIEETDSHIRLGAAVTFSAAMPILIEHFPALHSLLRRFASPPVRNAATIGGNVANGSPIGDSMPALIALGAQVTLRKGKQQRDLPLEALYLDYMVNDLQPGEFVEAVTLPKPKQGQFFRSYKLSKRFDQDISAVCSAFAIMLDGERCHDVRIAFGGVAATPKRASGCEAVLEGQVLTEALVQQAMDALDKDFTPLSDMRASDQYRRESTRNLLYRFYLAVSQPDAELEVYDYGR